MVTFDDKHQEQKIARIKRQEGENLAQMLSVKYGLSYQDLSITGVNTDALLLLSEEEAREAKVAIFQRTGKKIGVGVLSPGTDRTKQVLHELKERGFAPTAYMVSETSLAQAWKRYAEVTATTQTRAGLLTISPEDVAVIMQDLHSLEDVATLIAKTVKSKQRSLTTRIFEVVLAGALALKASDIHIEPEETYVRLRFRLDGILTDITTLEAKAYSLLLSRVKLLSGLKLNIGKEAQDGRFSVSLGKTDIEIRTSVLPGAYGESIVLRVLNPDTIAVNINKLGIEPGLFAIIERQIKKPNGLVLTTGPTGSGKTSTLYAFLKTIHTPDIKIITIENPIEYHLAGIVQTQTKKGYTFADGLRAALRQDPDAIMVGEIRDEETAEIAINAALTGHIVFSTLHTNNAAGTFSRLIDLGVNPKVISSAVNIALAQRLVRKLCGECKKEIPLESSDKEKVEKILASITRKDIEMPQSTVVWKGEGCTQCNNSGYSGRIGLFEAIIVDDAVDAIIQANPSEHEIRVAAAPQEILTMLQDGIVKVLRGVTTLEELGRVVDIEGELETTVP